MKKRVVPSIIAKTQPELYERLKKTKGSQLIHLDIMDGKFVKSKSLGFDFITSKKSEAHLMISNPEEWIRKNSNKAKTFIVHIETCRNPKRVISLAKNRKKKIGFALNPRTPISSIKDYLGKIDQVVIMTVTPGKYSGKFLPSTLSKVKLLRKLKPRLDIEVDGGMNTKTIKLAQQAGANMFVSGSYIQNAKDPKEAMEKLEKWLK